MKYKSLFYSQEPCEISFKDKDRFLKIYNLLERIKYNDEAAEEELIFMFLPLISKYSSRLLTYEEDCQQELIIEFYKALHSFDIYKNNCKSDL